MSDRTYIAREEIITKVGLNAAIIHERLKYIVEQNERECRNIKDDKYWVANTYSDWVLYFPFFTERQIRSCFKKLISEGLVETASYNKQNTDRTIWYTTGSTTQDVVNPDMTNMSDACDQNVSSACDQNVSSACDQNVSSYKDLDNIRLPLDLKTKAKKPTAKELAFNILSHVASDEVVNGFIEMRWLIKAPMTEHSASLIASKLRGKINANEILNLSTENNWKSVFPDSRQLNQRNQDGKPNKIDGNNISEWAERAASIDLSPPPDGT